MRSAPLALVLVAASACSSAPSSGSLGSAQAAHATPPAPPTAARVEPAPLSAVTGDALASLRRDPFRAAPSDAAPPPVDTRPRKARHHAVDELRLVGVVTRTAEPRAMLMDPRGRGWIVSPGDLVGRAEGAPEGVSASYRVDQIREGEVVLIRDEASSVVVTKVLALRHEPLLAADD